MEKDIIEYLWSIIDDIDTASDIAKSDSDMYRKMVDRLVSKRWETGITTDGYKLDLSTMKTPNDFINNKGWIPGKSNGSLIKSLIEELRKDQTKTSYYNTWKSNIAIAFQNEYEKSSASVFNINEVANKAAENFLQLLISN